MAFCSDDHPGAFLSALVFTGELFDEGLTKGDLEEAIARILEIPSENLVQGVGGGGCTQGELMRRRVRWSSITGLLASVHL